MRDDLYYRLSVFEIELPPLRRRIDDLSLLIDTLSTRLGRREVEFSDEALACLRGYASPGNVRELRNILERATLLAGGASVGVEQLSRQCTGNTGLPVPGADDDVLTLEAMERRYLRAVLTRHRGIAVPWPESRVSARARRTGSWPR